MKNFYAAAGHPAARSCMPALRHSGRAAKAARERNLYWSTKPMDAEPSSAWQWSLFLNCHPELVWRTASAANRVHRA